MSEKLLEWPSENLTMTGDVEFAYQGMIWYERARAEAALARLRVAVETLEALAGEAAYQYPPETNRNRAALALYAIGPLPDLPPDHQGAGE